MGHDVRYWHKADIPSCPAPVRFRGKSRRDVLHCKCLLLTQSGHEGSLSTPITQFLRSRSVAVPV
jgi:hypothetical protein